DFGHAGPVEIAQDLLVVVVLARGPDTSIATVESKREDAPVLAHFTDHPGLAVVLVTIGLTGGVECGNQLTPRVVLVADQGVDPATARLAGDRPDQPAGIIIEDECPLPAALS